MNDMSHVEISPVFVGLTGNLTVGHVVSTSSRCDGPIEISGWKSPWPKDEKWWIVTSCTSDSSICFIVHSCFIRLEAICFTKLLQTCFLWRKTSASCLRWDLFVAYVSYSKVIWRCHGRLTSGFQQEKPWINSWWVNFNIESLHQFDLSMTGIGMGINL